MNRLTAYFMGDEKNEFIKKLEEERFRLVSVGKDSIQVCTLKEGGNYSLYSLGYLREDYLFVGSITRKNEVEISERSRLLKIADDFGTGPNLSLIDRHLTP